MLEGQNSIEAVVFKITRRFLTAFISTLILFLLVAVGFVFFFYIDESITVEGVIEPSVCLFVKPGTSGIIKEVFVNDGEYVEKGRLLAEIDDADLRINLDKLTEDLEIAKNNLINAKHELELLRVANLNRIEQAKVSLKQAQIELENESSIVNLSKSIYSERIKEMNLTDPKQEPLELRKRRIAVEQAELDLKVSQDEKAKETLKQIEVENLGKTVSKTESEIAFIQGKLGETKICAPADGYLLTSDVEKLKGSYVTEGQNLFRIGNFSTWITKAYVAEQNLPRIRKGQKAKLYIKAYPYERYKIFNGVVEEISFSSQTANANNPMLNFGGTAFYLVVISIQDPVINDGLEELSLYDGLLANVKIIMKKERILSALLDKLFFTSAKLKNTPLHTGS